jgi:hypothetical protein
MFEFLAYTFLVATWASVYHFAMEKRGASPFAKLRIPFIMVNTIIAAIVFGLFGAIGSTTDENEANRLVIAGTHSYKRKHFTRCVADRCLYE